MIKRFYRLDIATADLADAGRLYEHNFGFSVSRDSAEQATIKIGDAAIRLRSGAAAAEVIAATGEGLAAIWLEAEDVDSVAAALKQAGVGCSAVYHEGERRVIAVDPKSANMVPLMIFNRRP